MENMVVFSAILKSVKKRPHNVTRISLGMLAISVRTSIFSFSTVFGGVTWNQGGYLSYI